MRLPKLPTMLQLHHITYKILPGLLLGFSKAGRQSVRAYPVSIIIVVIGEACYNHICLQLCKFTATKSLTSVLYRPLQVGCPGAKVDRWCLSTR